MPALTDRNSNGKFLILVDVDFSDGGPDVLQSAAAIASATADAELHLVHAFGPAIRADELRGFSALSGLASIEDVDEAGDALHKIAASIPIRDTRVCAHVHEGNATAVIAQLADEIEADLIVVGNHVRPGEQRAVFGSVAERLVRAAPCPVLIIRSKSPNAPGSTAPVCPACEATKRLTWGAHVRCLDHAPCPGEGAHRPRSSTFDFGAETVTIH